MKKCLISRTCTDGKKCTCKNDCFNYCGYGYMRTKMIENSNIPLPYIANTPNKKFIHDVSKDIGEYRKLLDIIVDDRNDNFKNIVIWGESCGCGKTFWASHLGYAYICKYNKPEENANNRATLYAEYPVQFVVVSELIGRIKASWNQTDFELRNYLQMLKEVPLVIWDDFLSVGDYDKTTQHTLFNLINERISFGKQNIFTTNINPDNWSEMAGAPLASRIKGGSLIVEFKEGDLRTYDLEGIA